MTDSERLARIEAELNRHTMFDPPVATQRYLLNTKETP